MKFIKKLEGIDTSICEEEANKINEEWIGCHQNRN